MLRFALMACVATATGILGDEVPASYPTTVIHVPVIEGSGQTGSFDQLLQETEKLQKAMQSHHASMGKHFRATPDAAVHYGTARFLGNASSHMGEPTMSDVESIAGLAVQAANAYKGAAAELPSREGIAKKIATANQQDLAGAYAADADIGGASRRPAAIRGA